MKQLPAPPAERSVIEAAVKEWGGRKEIHKGCKCTWCPGVRAVARLLRRYTWSHEKQTMVECDAGGFVLYTDAVKMQAALLSVLRQCVEALERCDKHFQHGAGYVCDAICAARPYIERKEGNPSVTKAVVDR